VPEAMTDALRVNSGNQWVENGVARTHATGSLEGDDARGLAVWRDKVFRLGEKTRILVVTD
jgi:hypothetical protein